MLCPLTRTAERGAQADDIGECGPEPCENREGDVPHLGEAVPEHGYHHQDKERYLEEAAPSVNLAFSILLWNDLPRLSIISGHFSVL